MSYRDYAAWAAKQYGVDPGIIDGIAKYESGYRPDAHNAWDSNAQAGTPSRGIAQFIQPTFNAYAKEAAKANPNAWQKFGGKFDWLNPQQQLLATAWAVANGKGSAWTTFDRAKQYAQNGYDYKPKWQMGAAASAQPGQTVAAVDPKQLATVKAEFDNAIKLRQGQVKDASDRLGKFDAITDEQKQLLNYRYGAREAQNLDMRERAGMAQGLTAAQQNVADMKVGAKQQLTDSQANVTKLQQQRDQTIDQLAKMQLPDPKSELGRLAGGANSGMRAQLVATARQEVGTVASKAMKYIRAAGGTGYEPWCGDFVQYVFKQNGLKPPPARSVPTLLSWAKGNDTFRNTGRAGDLVMFDWNSDGVPDHVEMVTGGRGEGRYQTIGGNTSGPQASSQVAQKMRSSNVLGFVDALSLLTGGGR